MMNVDEPRTDASETDTELLNRASQGDADAFGEFFGRRWSWAVRIARQYRPLTEDAEDAAATAFANAWRAIGRWHPDASPAAWLWEIIRNACVDQQRRDALRPTLPWLPEMDDRPASRIDEQPEAALMVAEETRPVVLAVEGLSPKLRRVLVLVARDRLLPIEIARSDGVAHSTIDSRLHRGRAAVRLAVGKEPSVLPPALSDDRIAGLRAAGLPWTTVALRAGRSKEYCRRACLRAAAQEVSA